MLYGISVIECIGLSVGGSVNLALLKAKTLIKATHEKVKVRHVENILQITLTFGTTDT